ncbi:DNA replication factor C complex subunit Ctf18 [Schizosaccharomyces cryophilus OY26]|uniref:DNA replication factor C complex subunit Ctf18 n=1 Tax=Schizosaccharomyces cryophilus (strain OY26 / ATCC MYA-4695 / CBS 11777 / NBRC 106824 / NRRL Y48691) TaxID=653667 RepID=S9VRF1_SCHCR|nr:DNA replication factor C complex subunit Ctf18 [Schizosaccharomyces cryophilus OY26]EPY50523.1 DNA replication factor C complex subunit Ctf18 [Schizosaccharomyces cryophilus OY26]
MRKKHRKRAHFKDPVLRAALNRIPRIFRGIESVNKPDGVYASMDFIPNDEDLQQLLEVEQEKNSNDGEDEFQEDEEYLLEMRNANSLENLEHRNIPNELFHSSQPIGSPTRNGNDLPSTLDLYSSSNGASSMDSSMDEDTKLPSVPDALKVGVDKDPEKKDLSSLKSRTTMDIDTPLVDPKDNLSQKQSLFWQQDRPELPKMNLDFPNEKFTHVNASQESIDSLNNSIPHLSHDTKPSFSFKEESESDTNSHPFLFPSISQDLHDAKSLHNLDKPLPNSYEHPSASSSSTFGSVTARSSSGAILHFPRRYNRHMETLPQQRTDYNAELSKTPFFKDTLLRNVQSWAKDFQLQPKVKADLLSSGGHANSTSASPASKTLVRTEEMWVDKYRPQLFRDLIGDERVHRDAMRWMKAWDPFVFGHISPHASASPRQLAFSKASAKESGRPDRRIMILTGQAGSGKTTLAHVIARQAGYKVLEINASDDRTANTVHEKIGAAVSYHSALSSQPTCIVADEVDGGDPAFIRALVTLLESDEKASLAQATSKSKKRSKQKKLCRPIICICNDLYTPALRPLRPYAQVVYFNAPPQATLVGRLRSICRSQNLSIDSRSLTLLTDIYNSDIRSCLNSLQLLSLKSSSINQEMIKYLQPKSNSSANSGLLSSLLHRPDARFLRSIEASQISYSHIDTLLNMIESGNDVDATLMDCFHIYLQMPFTDNLFSKPVITADWLYFFDRLNKLTYGGHHELWKYMPYSIIHFHYLYASANKVKLARYPRYDLEMMKLRRDRLEILDTFMSSFSPNDFEFYKKQTVLLDLIDPLLGVINPSIKKSSRNSNADDKLKIEHAVRIIDHYNLRLNHIPIGEGQYTYRLEPPLEELVWNPPSSTYSTRQLLSQELFRKRLEQVQKNSIPKVSSSESTKKKRKEAGLERSIRRDFFGREIKVPQQNDKSPDTEKSPIASEKVIAVNLKFHDGFSNAIRKPISLHDILHFE